MNGGTGGTAWPVALSREFVAATPHLMKLCKGGYPKEIRGGATNFKKPKNKK